MGWVKNARATRSSDCTTCHRQRCVCNENEARALRSAMREANRKYMRKHPGGKRARD